MISLSRWRERVGVRMDLISAVSPSPASSPLSLCDIPTTIFFIKVEGDWGEEIKL
jgi:hypothetical protein